MPVSVLIQLDELSFAALEREVQEIRRWLDAGPDTRAGRGGRYVSGALRRKGHHVTIEVLRDKRELSLEEQERWNGTTPGESQQKRRSRR